MSAQDKEQDKPYNIASVGEQFMLAADRLLHTRKYSTANIKAADNYIIRDMEALPYAKPDISILWGVGALCPEIVNGARMLARYDLLGEQVVCVGGNMPSKMPFAAKALPIQTKKLGLPMPEKGETEAHYMQHALFDAIMEDGNTSVKAVDAVVGGKRCDKIVKALADGSSGKVEAGDKSYVEHYNNAGMIIGHIVLPYYGRRTISTMQRHGFDQTAQTITPVMPETLNFTWSNYLRSPISQALLAAEYQNTKDSKAPFVRDGFCNVIDVPTEAAELVRVAQRHNVPIYSQAKVDKILGLSL